MYREWKTTEFPKKVLYMNMETKGLRYTKKQMAIRSEGGCKTSWWERVEGKGI
jgi:hypothetical protein